MKPRKETAPDLPLPLQFLVAGLASWICRHQQQAVEYLRAENRALRRQLGDQRVRLTDPERRRLATLGAALGRKALAEVLWAEVTP